MNIIKKMYCRIYQTVFHWALPVLPYREPKILNSVRDIPKLLKSKRVKSVLLVTDRFLKAHGITEELENLLKENNINCAVYHKTCANPTVENVEAARELYIKEKCQWIIAFGGGSPMDCAKAVGARIAYPKKTVQELQGLLRVHRKIPTLIAIPTTAGTGSEVTPTALITDSEKKLKCTMNDFTLIPHYAVLDPKVTFTLPPNITAATGLDVLTHAIEAYIGGSTSAETRRYALRATEIVFQNLETAYNDATNYTARKNMLEASYKAGISFSKSFVGYIHAIAHTLGGQYNIPHGLANAILLPVLLEEYGESVYKKLHQLGLAAGVCSKYDTEKEGAEKFINAIKELNLKMNIPAGFKEIQTEDIPIIAKHADKEANPLYPVPRLMNAKELEKIYHRVKV